jgi:proline iminopeptidase
MREPHPESTGMLDVGDGNHVYWEVCGNPAGRPAVVLHGGPGIGSGSRHRKLFDLDRYRLVLFDQRGCGRSTPNAGSPDADLTNNTTTHLIADMELLREHLGIDRWLLLGGSWGSTLALAYAQRHAARVAGMILFGVTTGRRQEQDWYWGGGAGHLFPEAWHNLLDVLPPSRRNEDLVEVYHDLLHDPDPLVRRRATAAWNEWDDATMSLQPRPQEPPSLDGPDTVTDTDADADADAIRAYTAARICVHYLRHGAWLPEGGLLRDAGKLNTIPGIIVQGRYDLQTPAVTAWELSRVWRTATLTMVENAGHAPLDPALRDALLRATDAFAGPAGG